MFFLKHILAFLVLPPGNLAVAIFIGFLLLRRLPRLGRAIIGVCSILLLLLGMPVVGDSLILSLERNLPVQPPADAPPEAIVILGGDMIETGGASPGYTVGSLSLQRLRAGADLYRRTHLPILITGGRLRRSAPPISQLMAQVMQQDFHVPVRWTETRSRDTWENAANTAVILRAAGIRSVYVVTHAWHERRAMIAFHHTGLIATAAPTAFNRYTFGFPSSLMPSATVWLRSYFALHEWVGCVWYSLP